MKPVDLALDVLTAFFDNSSYEDYREEGGWSDDDYEDTLWNLRKGVLVKDEKVRRLLTLCVSYAMENAVDVEEAFQAFDEDGEAVEEEVEVGGERFEAPTYDDFEFLLGLINENKPKPKTEQEGTI